MTNVSIILTEDRPENYEFPEKQVLKQIQKASDSNWTHVQVLIDSTLYESTINGGFKKTDKYTFRQNANNKQIPLQRDLTVSERSILRAWWENKLYLETKYGIIKVLAYAFLYKSRPFWEAINYFPMQYDPIWGDFCSAAVANSLKYLARGVGDISLDFNPEINGEVFTPGDFDR